MGKNISEYMVGNRFGILMFFVALAMALAGCTRNEFKVTVEAPKDFDRAYTLSYYASDPVKGWNVAQTLSVREGKGEAVCITREPTLVVVDASEGRYPLIVMYAERGDNLKIHAEGADPLKWKASGNDITEKLSDWRTANAAVIAKAMNTEEGAAKANAAVAEYVANHPEDPAATILLLMYYDRSLDEAGFRKLWGKLSGEAKSEKWLNLVPRPDIANIGKGEDKLPETTVLRTLSATRDTLKPKGKPVLLYFTKTRMAGYRDGMGRMRQLNASAADSASRLIAEISLDPDSSSRWQPVRTDSLVGIVRGWMPLALSDPEAKALGVGGVPYVIVADRKGKVIYRGDDLGKAIEKFNRQ